MVKLRFIQPWGPYKPGEIKETASLTTVHWLVDVYKFAVIEPDNPIATAPPVAPVTDATAPKFVECDTYKYIRKPPRDKMTKRPIGAK